MEHGPAAPIPVSLAHLRVHAGMVVPWATAVTEDGVLFGTLDFDRQRQAILERRCQVCGRELGDRTVLLLRDSDLLRRRTSEPGLHPWCASYTKQTCPMVAGRMAHHRTTSNSGYEGPRLGADAEPWHEVWVTGYHVVEDVEAGQLTAAYGREDVLTVREVSRPAHQHGPTVGELLGLIDELDNLTGSGQPPGGEADPT